MKGHPFPSRLTKLRTPREAALLWHTRYTGASRDPQQGARAREEADLAFEQDLVNAGFRNLYDDAILNIDFHVNPPTTHKPAVVVILESGCELHFPIK